MRKDSNGRRELLPVVVGKRDVGCLWKTGSAGILGRTVSERRSYQQKLREGLKI